MHLFRVATQVAQRLIGLPIVQKSAPPGLKISTLYGLAVAYSSKAIKLRPNFIDVDCGFNHELIKAVITSPSSGEGVASLPFSNNGYDANYYINSANTAHGGLQSSLHDLAGCKAVMSQGHHGATRSLAVNFSSSHSLGTAKLLEARAKVLEVKDGKAYVESTLKQDDKELSTASMVFKVWSADMSVPAEPLYNENGGNLDSSLIGYSAQFLK